jgi:hypothetical protein
MPMGFGDAGLGHLRVIEQREHDGEVIAPGCRLPVMVLVPLLDQPGAGVGELVALVTGDESQDLDAGARAADGAAVPGADPQLTVRAADEGNGDVVAAPVRPASRDRLAQRDVRLGDGRLRIGAHVGVQQQLGRGECLQNDRLGVRGLGHDVLLPQRW